MYVLKMEDEIVLYYIYMQVMSMITEENNPNHILMRITSKVDVGEENLGNRSKKLMMSKMTCKDLRKKT